MNYELVRSQFKCLSEAPSDQVLLKQLAVQVGNTVRRAGCSELLEFRQIVSESLGKLMSRSDTDALFASGVLTGLADALAVAWEMAQ